MFRKGFIIGVLLMGGLMSPVWAATYTIPTSQLEGLGYYQNLAPHTGQTSIQDIYNFTLTSGHDTAFHVQAFDMPPYFSLVNLLMAVHAGPDGTGPLVQSAPSDLNLLIPGGVPHSLVVTGDVDGAVGGSYAVGITLAPVPVPASGWLMLGAVASMTLIGRLRRTAPFRRPSPSIAT